MKKIIFLLILFFDSIFAATMKEEGLNYLKKQDYYSAISFLQNALKVAPEDDEIRYALGISYLAVNNEQEGFALLYDLASKTNKFSLKSFLDISSYLIGKNRHREALDILLKAWNRFPQDTKIFTLLTSVFEKLSMWNELLSFLDNPITPKDSDSARKKISALLGCGKTNEALSFAFSYGNSQQDSDLPAFFYRRIDKIDKAIEIYLDLYKKTKDTSFVVEAAYTLIEKKRSNDAGKLVLDSIPSEDDAISILKALALYDTLIQLYIEKEKNKPGLDLSKELIPLYQKTSKDDLLIERIVLYLKNSGDIDFVKDTVYDLAFIRGKKKELIEKFEYSVNNFNLKQRIPFFILLSDIYIKSFDRVKAYSTVENLIMQTGLIDYGFGYGLVFKRKDWRNESEKIFETILSVKSEKTSYKANAIFELAKIKYENGNFKDSLSLLDRLEQEYPGIFATDIIYDLKSSVLLASGAYSDVLKLLENVKKKNKDMLLREALCFYMLNDTKRAFNILDQIKEKDMLSDVNYLKGIFFLNSGDFEKSIDSFIKSSSDPLASSVSLNAMVEIFFLKNLLENNDPEIQNIYSRALIAMLVCKYSESADLFFLLAKKINKMNNFFLYRAAVAMANGKIKIEETLKILDSVKNDKELPSFIKSHASELMADLLVYSGNIDRALEQYRNILLENPSYPRQNLIRDRINRIKMDQR